MDYAHVEMIGIPSKTKKSVKKWKREFYKKAGEVIPQQMFRKNLIVKARVFCNDKVDFLFIMDLVKSCLAGITRNMKKEEVEIKMVEIQRIYQNKQIHSAPQASSFFIDEQEEEAPDKIIFEFLPALKL